MIYDSEFKKELSWLSGLDKKYIDPDDLKRYMRLFKTQVDLFQNIEQLDSRDQPELPKKDKFESGNPLVDPLEIKFEDGWAFDSLARTCSVLFRSEVDSSAMEEFCRDLFESDSPVKFLKWSMGGERIDEESIIKRTELGIEQIRLWGREAVRPWFWRLADLSRKIDLSEWQFGFCPVCGYRPELALLVKDEGFRQLVCGMCHYRWEFRRMRCPYCDTKDEKKLRHFFLKEDDPSRVYVCDNCKGYIKTIDTRKWVSEDKIYPRVQMILTLHLDALAEREGFTTSPEILKT